MFNRKSDYALNKLDPDAIVYTDTDGTLMRITREDFESEDDFLKWKSWSDEAYHETEKTDHRYANHKLSLELLSERETAGPGVEEVVMATWEDQDKMRLVQSIHMLLSEKQFRRLWLYFVCNLSTYEIGRREKVSHQAVLKSIHASEKKVSKFFKNGLPKGLPKGGR